MDDDKKYFKKTYKGIPIKIGLEKSFQIKISESMLDTFSQLSGDVNPLHMEKKYAISQDIIFGEMI